MAEERTQRRLAAILAADVVGYSRLMEQDEADTYERLRAHRKDSVRAAIEGHHGRIFKLMGDGVARGVRQRRRRRRMRRRPAARHGGAQRRAARRPAHRLAHRHQSRRRHRRGRRPLRRRRQHRGAAGGARRARRHLRFGRLSTTRSAGKLESDFEDLGEQQVKNIAEPVRVYRVPGRHGEAARRGPTCAGCRRQAVDRRPAVRRT